MEPRIPYALDDRLRELLNKAFQSDAFELESCTLITNLVLFLLKQSNGKCKSYIRACITDHFLLLEDRIVEAAQRFQESDRPEFCVNRFLKEILYYEELWSVLHRTISMVSDDEYIGNQPITSLRIRNQVYGRFIGNPKPLLLILKNIISHKPEQTDEKLLAFVYSRIIEYLSYDSYITSNNKFMSAFWYEVQNVPMATFKKFLKNERFESLSEIESLKLNIVRLTNNLIDKKYIYQEIQDPLSDPKFNICNYLWYFDFTSADLQILTRWLKPSKIPKNIENFVNSRLSGIDLSDFNDIFNAVRRTDLYNGPARDSASDDNLLIQNFRNVIIEKLNMKKDAYNVIYKFMRLEFKKYLADDTSGGEANTTFIQTMMSILDSYICKDKFFKEYYQPNLIRRMMFDLEGFTEIFKGDNLESTFFKYLSSADFLPFSIIELVNSAKKCIDSGPIFSKHISNFRCLLLPYSYSNLFPKATANKCTELFNDEKLLTTWNDFCDDYNMRKGRILSPLFEFNVVEIETPIIVDEKNLTKLTLKTNLYVYSILNLFNERDSLPVESLKTLLNPSQNIKIQQIFDKNLDILLNEGLLMISKQFLSFNYAYMPKSSRAVKSGKYMIGSTIF